MADIQALLTKKAGPLPVWGWAAIGGGLAGVLYLRSKGQAQPAATSSTPGDGQSTDSGTPAATSPVIVTPATMTGSTSSGNPVTSDQVLLVSSITGWKGVPAYSSPSDSATYSQLPFASQWPVTGSLVPGGQYGGFWPVKGPGGSTLYVHGVDVATFIPSTGMGGGGVLKMLPGGGKVGRFNSPHAHPQFLSVRGMGGGGSHALKDVSRRTGIPEIRLMALNQRHWRPGERRPDHIHIR